MDERSGSDTLDAPANTAKRMNSHPPDQNPSPAKAEMPAPTGVVGSEFVQCVEISSELKTNLSVMKRIMGERWKQATGEYRAVLLAAMVGSGDTNPLACAVPIAKEMSERGHIPLMLLAVATEMSEASNSSSTELNP